MAQEISATIEARRAEPEDVLRYVEPGADIVVGSANAEPVRVSRGRASGPTATRS
jgi:hypothetical protein